MDWQVLDDTPLPPEPEIAPRARQLGRGPFVGVCLLLLLTALAVAGRARVAEARLRTDLGAAVAAEERALRGGQAEQARTLSHPALIGDWPAWYEGTFQRVTEPLSLPTVRAVEFDGGTALVTLSFKQGEYSWQEVRAYRLLEGRWRRLPVPEGRWGLAQAYHSDHFTLWLAPRDAAVLPPEPLLRDLEAFHAALAAQWSLRAGDRSVEVRLVADETLTEPQVGVSRVRVRSPLLAPFGEGIPLRHDRAERLALFGAVAATLDIPSRAPRDGNPGLRAALRDTVVRRLVLSEAEQAAFDGALRAAWQATQPDEGDLPRPDSPLFASFVSSLGAEWPRRMADTVTITSNYEPAIAETLGQSWGTLRYGWERWLKMGEVPTFSRQPGGIQGGQLVAAVPLGQASSESASPMWRLTLTPRNGVQEISLGTEAIQLPAPACLHEGTEATWHFDAAGNVDDLRLGTVQLDSWAVAPPPPDAHTMALRPVQGGSSLLVLDRIGQEIELARLPANVVALPNGASAAPRFAFLAMDECGRSVNVYLRERDLLLRAALPPLSAPRLFWESGPFPLIVDQQSGDEGETWRVYAVREGWGAALGVYEVARGAGHVLGFSTARGRMLVQDGAGLNWAYPGQSDALVPLPLEGAGNIEFGTLAPGGRWLVYTVHHVGGDADLLALDVVTERTVWLDSLPPSVASGEMRAASGEALRLATVQGSLGEERGGLKLGIYEWSSPYNSLVRRVQLPLVGDIGSLLWCPTGERLLLESDTDAPTLLTWGAGGLETLAAGGGQPLWCQ